MKICVVVDGSFFEKETKSANQLMLEMKLKEFKQKVSFENELIIKDSNERSEFPEGVLERICS